MSILVISWGLWVSDMVRSLRVIFVRLLLMVEMLAAAISWLIRLGSWVVGRVLPIA